MYERPSVHRDEMVAVNRRDPLLCRISCNLCIYVINKVSFPRCVQPIPSVSTLWAPIVARAVTDSAKIQKEAMVV